jgi:hypothetical protein
MKDWSIGKRLFVGFGSVAVMATVMSGLGLWATSALNQRVAQLAGVSGAALQQAADVRFLVADLDARERLVVIAVAKQDTAVVTAETSIIQQELAQLHETSAALAASGVSGEITDKAKSIDEAMRARSAQWE